jgi:hypothetical protein
MSATDQPEPAPWIDAQGIVLLALATTLAFVLGSAALWIGLH